MIVIGSVSSEEEKRELMFAAKAFVVGQRAQELSRQGRKKDANSNKEKGK